MSQPILIRVGLFVIALVAVFGWYSALLGTADKLTDLAKIGFVQKLDRGFQELRPILDIIIASVVIRFLTSRYGFPTYDFRRAMLVAFAIAVACSVSWTVASLTILSGGPRGLGIACYLLSVVAEVALMALSYRWFARRHKELPGLKDLRGIALLLVTMMGSRAVLLTFLDVIW